jgi:hypothetical protein
MGSAAQNPVGVEWFGLVMGLGFVLYFGYWCMDFRVIERAMAAGSLSAARRTPLVAAIPKMFFPFLAILPGMIALAVSTGSLTPASQGRTIAQGVSSSVAYVRSTAYRAKKAKRLTMASQLDVASSRQRSTAQRASRCAIKTDGSCSITTSLRQ